MAIGHPVSCCGVVESWTALIDINALPDPVFISFHIWRHVSGSNYTLVGQNRFCKCACVLLHYQLIYVIKMSAVCGVRGASSGELCANF